MHGWRISDARIISMYETAPIITEYGSFSEDSIVRYMLLASFLSKSLVKPVRISFSFALVSAT